MKRSLALFLVSTLILGFVGLFGLVKERPADEAAQVLGLWRKHRPGKLGDPLRFYYFHEGGKGLYRYGRVGYAYTNSFDYRVEKRTLHLHFRKTGERYRVPFEIVREGGREVLVLKDDPREPGAGRYTKERLGQSAAEEPFSSPGGQMWIDLRRYETGGEGFSIYQLAPASIDGRGIGWHHRGDFDDWSTEALTYQIVGDTLALRFMLRGEEHDTRFALEGGPKGTLLLEEDPRNFWHRSKLKHMGRSFEAAWLAARP